MIGVIGFLCRDSNIKEFYNEKVEHFGGKAYYEGVALSNIGVPSRIMFYADDNSQDIIKTMSLPNLELHRIKCEKTPLIQNIYKDKELEIRDYKMFFNKFRYTPEMIDNGIKECEYLIICPINPREIDISMLQYLRKNTKARIAIDLDFYIDDADENGKVTKMKIEDLNKILSNLDIAAISKKDRIINGSDEDILRYIGKKGAKEVIMTQGSKGALIYSKKEDKVYEIPVVKPEKIVSVTGAGDTFLAGYVAARHEGKNVEEAGRFAVKAASAKLKYLGALQEKVEI